MVHPDIQLHHQPDISKLHFLGVLSTAQKLPILNGNLPRTQIGKRSANGGSVYRNRFAFLVAAVVRMQPQTGCAEIIPIITAYFDELFH